jgi:hypothetical protein
MARRKYNLVGINGNAFSVMGYVANAMRECGFKRDAIDEYRRNAMSSDYDHLISVSIVAIDACNIAAKKK